MPPHPFCVWNFQFGVGRSLDGNDRLVLETADGADVLIRDVGQRGVWGQGVRTAREIWIFDVRPHQGDIEMELRVKDISDYLHIR